VSGTAPLSCQELDHLSTLAGDYDCLICDIWGVVHNGVVPFPLAVTAMQTFRRERGPVILLSNAPRLSGDVQLQLDKLGVARDAYDAIVTSGEATRAELERRTRERTLPMLHIGPPRDNGVFDGLNVRLTKVDEADVVLATGLYDDEREGPDDYRPMLEAMAARGLAMLCANPDVTVQRGDALIYCAGALADAYENMGGTVRRYGKPFPAVFREAIAQAKRRGAGERPMMIGDNPETDLKGANGVGIDALFVAGGILSAEIGQHHARVEALLTAAGVRARGWMNVLSWSSLAAAQHAG
jgi:HAD superfamily hydrolase (TIGR01459 family)